MLPPQFYRRRMQLIRYIGMVLVACAVSLLVCIPLGLIVVAEAVMGLNKLRKRLAIPW